MAWLTIPLLAWGTGFWLVSGSASGPAAAVDQFESSWPSLAAGGRLDPQLGVDARVSATAATALSTLQRLCAGGTLSSGCSASTRDLVRDVEWGRPEFLVVDLPPGTADLQQTLVRELPLAGALVVVGPQDAAHLDALKLIDLLRDSNVRVLGGVENMSGLVCPHCGETIDVFPRVADDRSLWTLGVRLLATLPIDPAIVGNGRGPLLVSAPE